MEYIHSHKECVQNHKLKLQEKRLKTSAIHISFLPGHRFWRLIIFPSPEVTNAGIQILVQVSIFLMVNPVLDKTNHNIFGQSRLKVKL